MSWLDDSWAMQVSGDAFVAVADPQYEANTGMFGGWTAGLLLKAVLEHGSARGSASAFTANFIRRVVPGERILIRATKLGESRSVAHWRADLHRIESGELLVSAAAILALRQESDRATDHVAPAAPPPDGLQASSPPGAFGRRTETRSVYGLPPFGREDLRSLGWVRETSGRHVDAVQLAYLSDFYAPRVFHISEERRPFSTLTMSIYFLAGDDELASVGDDYVLCEAEGTRIEQSIVGSRARLWSRQGHLLATTEQLGWFK